MTITEKISYIFSISPLFLERFYELKLIKTKNGIKYLDFLKFSFTTSFRQKKKTENLKITFLIFCK
jgi:hypothetical protein